jgi:hypothetical protein
MREQALVRLAAPLLLGLALGAVILGVGGRVAMRAIAVANGSPGTWTVGGTMTVIACGAAAGAGGGLILAVLERALARAPVIRRVAFGAILIALTLRGLRPIQPLALELFGPLVVVYGAALDVASTRWRRRTDANTGTGMRIVSDSPAPARASAND